MVIGVLSGMLILMFQACTTAQLLKWAVDLGKFIKGHFTKLSKEMKHFSLSNTGLAVLIVLGSIFFGFLGSDQGFQITGHLVSTSATSVSLVATFESISVYAKYADDDDNDNSAIIEYRQGSGVWKQAHDPWMERGVREARGSIVGLAPDTSYEARVTFS